MPMTWNHQVDAKLLVAVIKVGKPKLDFDALAKFMGEGCTAYAIQHRIRKLQAKANGKDQDDKSAPTTPSKRENAGGDKPSTPKKSKASSTSQTTRRPQHTD
ncbi:hypothetical protein VTN00DRAFT_3097 [Thermoascus crustaceus]|uniref:uncharacterized protein n=1 Tax=Thermoascus crustaceus TaxID=5088 RepID=UPI003743D74B